MSTTNAARCPLCGAENRCAMAQNPDASDCWCFAAQVAASALAAIPEEAQGRVCICERCASGPQSTAAPGATPRD